MVNMVKKTYEKTHTLIFQYEAWNALCGNSYIYV